MYVVYLFLISTLFINVRCDCDTYVDCFGEFLREFFTDSEPESEKINKTNVEIKTKVYDASVNNETANIDTVISDLTNLIRDINKKIIESSIFLTNNDNKTKIAVKTFELDDDFENEDLIEKFSTTTEVTTTELKTEKEFLVGDVVTTSKSIVDNMTTISGKAVVDDLTTTSLKAKNITVIPIKSEKENEITNFDFDLGLDDENFTDYPNIDYIEIYKDTTNEFQEYIPTEPTINDLKTEIEQVNEIQNLIENSIHLLDGQSLSKIIENITSHDLDTKSQLEQNVFPWIAAIFLKNDSKGSQFDYFCDGAILSERAVLTAARCVLNDNGTYNAENFIVILGKTSLQASGGNEKILRVKSVEIHENFTMKNDVATNDLAILILEEPVAFNEDIAKVTLDNELPEKIDESTFAVTTAWSLPGDLTLIYFDKEKSKACTKDNKVENTFCATYGNVPFCPSYGGLYVIQRVDKLYLDGIRTGDPLRRSYCLSKDISFTSLHSYAMWITDIVG